MKLKYFLPLLFYISVPIIGSGTELDPYRADVPALLLKIPGLVVNAQIPSNPDGTPKFSDTYIWIPDRLLPPGLTAIPNTTARAAIKARDPKADPDGMEKTK